MLAQVAQPLAEGEGNGGLPDARRTKDSDHVSGHTAEYREQMTVQIGVGLSTLPDPFEAGSEAGTSAAQGLDGAKADLALAFLSGRPLAAPEAALEAIHEAVGAETLVGCGAGGVLAGGRELEGGSATAVWAASLAGGSAQAFHASLTDDEANPAIEGLPSFDQGGAAIVLADPYTFPTDALLSGLARDAPAVPILGGLASGRAGDGSAVLLYDEQVHESGAVGVLLDDVELLPCVSQGAAPLGPEVTITAAEGNVIHELAGRPALQTVERIIAGLTPAERALVTGGLLLGIVVEANKSEYEQGDFLVRGIAGADPDSGAMVVGALVHEGQVVRLHARNARSADEDLRRQLRLRREALAGTEVAGAIVFSCNGRGVAMFGAGDHDALAVQQELGGAPAAGFFAAGEIGPVAGRSFLHGFTATIAVLPH
jgi:small ligand-binding sensory domain FIST